MGVVVRRYIDILTIIINFPYSTCISSFFGSSIPTSLFIFKMFFRSSIFEDMVAMGSFWISELAAKNCLSCQLIVVARINNFRSQAHFKLP